MTTGTDDRKIGSSILSAEARKQGELIALADAMSSKLVLSTSPEAVGDYVTARAAFVKAVNDRALSQEQVEFLGRVEELVAANWNGLALHKFQCIREKMERNL